MIPHAQAIESLRPKVEQGTATEEERARIMDAISALDRAIKDKERGSSEAIILAQTHEGKEIRFDLREIRGRWYSFYRAHNLSDVADSLPSEIRLTSQQIETLKEKAKEGFTRAILIPAGIESHLQALKENLTDGYENDPDNNPIPTFLSNTVSPDFPDNITTTDPRRLNKPYLLLTNPNIPLHPDTKNKTADGLIPLFDSIGLSGLTLADFFIEERFHFDQTGEHLVDWSNGEETWLLASRNSASRVLGAYWVPDGRRVGVSSYGSGLRYLDLGSRSSVMFDLEP